MEKTKKRLISSAVLAAILVLAVVLGLLFGQNLNGNNMVAVTDVQSDGVITGVYNDIEDAATYFNTLTTTGGYTPVNSQSEFDTFFNTNAERTGGKYALNPSVSFTARNAKFLKEVEIDGCGASVSLSIDVNEAFSDNSLISSNSTSGIAELGLAANTMFYYAPRAGSEWVRIKPHGGFADYAVNVTVKNVKFSMTGGSASEVGKSDYGSVLIGGVFGITSNSTINNCSFNYDAAINIGYTLAKIGNAIDYRKNYRSRPYDLTLSFGMLTGYLYNSTVSDCSLNMGSSSSVRLKTNGVDVGIGTGKIGTPRSITGGLIGLAQNDNTIKNISVSGGGILTADPGSTYWEVEGAAKVGFAGALVGAVADAENRNDEYMLKAEGHTSIYNIVSTWTGKIKMWGIVNGSISYTITGADGNGLQGPLVGIKGQYAYSSTETVSAPDKNYLYGFYKLYDGDVLPEGNAVSYSYVVDNSEANKNYSKAGIEFSNVKIIEDGANWLTLGESDRKVDIGFSDGSLDITYDVTDPKYVAERTILWNYVEKVINGDQVTPTNHETWQDTGVTSYDSAVKKQTVSVPNRSGENLLIVNREFEFNTGYAAYYKIEGEDKFDLEDKLSGSVGTRTYSVLEKQYDGTLLTAPVVQFYFNSDMSGAPKATSTDASQWVAQKNGSGSYISLGDEQTKTVSDWYLSLKNNDSETVYAYYAAVDGKNYVAYKADNTLTSENPDLSGTPVTMRYYVYKVTQKIITPSVVEKSADDLVFDNAAKAYEVNFGSEICAGDNVTATLQYYSVSGDTESSVDSAVNAGDYRVKIEGISNANYALSDAVASHDFTVTKRALTSAISGETVFTYNKTNQSPTVTVSNQVPGVDQSAVVSITYRKNGVAASNIDAGEYEMEVALTTNAKANYTISGDLEKSFTINPADLTFTGSDLYEFTYDSIGISYEKLVSLSENPISIGNADLAYKCDFSVYFRPYVAGDDSMDGYDPSDITEVGEYDCIIQSNNTTNFNQLTHKIKIVIKKAVVTFGLTPTSGTPNEDGSYDYNGKEVSFKADFTGIGSLDLDFINFEAKIYPATYDNEAGKWVIVKDSEGVPSVINAGNYIVVVEQTTGGSVDNPDSNYDTTSNPGTRELAFTINKASLVWQFSGEGLEYHEESGEYWTEYNGQTFTLSLESADLESQLAEGDKGKYSLTGNVEYIRETAEGDYSVGTNGVRDAGNYKVVPEVNRGDNPELSVNYEIKGGVLAITQRVVTIVIKDIKVPYGTHFDEITGEGFSNMWSYAPGSNEFLPEDGQMLTFILRDIGMDEIPVRGTYPYTFIPSLVNENASNYQINKVNESGDNSYCTITGLELKLEVVVTDKDGAEVAVYPVESGTSYEASALYYGNDYKVSLRATNLEAENPGIAWVQDSYTFRNNADSATVRFTLTEEANQVYYIGADLSALGQEDGVFDVNFTVNKRNIEITPVDTDLEYGADNGTIGANGMTITGGDGFVEGEQDWFTYSYSTDLEANVGSTAPITVTANVKPENTGAEGNYNFVCNTGTATRVAKVLHVTLNNRQRTYGSDPLTVGAEYTLAQGETLVGEDVLEFVYVLTKDGEEVADALDLAAGTYGISVKLTNTNNYEIIVTEGATYNVDPKEVTVTFSSVTAEYDTAAHPIDVSVEGLIAGDENEKPVVQYFLNSEMIDGEPVNIGVYTVAANGFASGNYSVGAVNGGDSTVTITNVVVNVTVENAVSAYGTGIIVPANGNNVYFTSDSELFNSDDLKPRYVFNGGDASTKAVGTYENSLTLEFDGEAAGNYEINIVNAATLEIEVADLAEVAYLADDHSTYDGQGKAVEVDGVQDDQVKVVITKDGVEVDRNTGVVEAGEYIVTVTALSANYTGTATLTYTVNKAALDATLSSTSSTYTGNAVDLAGLVSSKYGEVVFTITMDGKSVNEVRNAGTYTITITAGENSNYTGSVEGLTYTVNKAQIATPNRDSFTVAAVWNGFTITDKSGKHEVLVVMTGSGWDGATNSITGLQPETEYTVDVKFAGDENYIESGVFTMTVKTGKKLAATLDPDDISYTVYYNQIVVKVNGSDSYAYSSDGGKTWKDSNTLSGLKAQTEYSISVKIKENASHGESNVVTVKLTTGADPSAFNNLFDSMGDTVTAADLDNYDKMMDAYEALADGDKANVDKTKLGKLQSSYNALIAEVNGDVAAAQNVARKAAGKGAAAAAASVLAVIVAAIAAKKKFVF